MRRRLWLVIVPIVLSITVIPARAWAADAEQLLRQGLVKESGERNLEGAIALYQQAIAEPGASPLIIFQARLRMADCYEHLGKSHEAEAVYRQIVDTSTGPPNDITREAQANLNRLKAQDRLSEVRVAAVSVPIFKNEFHPTRLDLSAGPTFLAAHGVPVKLDLSVRFRISSDRSRLAQYVEAGVLPPVGGAGIQDERFPDATSTNEHASLRLSNVGYVALSGEIPHSRQRLLIPVVGIGIARASSRVSYADAAGDAGETTMIVVSPYAHVELHFFSDRIVSLVLQESYLRLPYEESIQIGPAQRTETLDFPSALWMTSLKVQMKIGWFKRIRTMP